MSVSISLDLHRLNEYSAVVIGVCLCLLGGWGTSSDMHNGIQYTNPGFNQYLLFFGILFCLLVLNGGRRHLKRFWSFMLHPVTRGLLCLFLGARIRNGGNFGGRSGNEHTVAVVAFWGMVVNGVFCFLALLK